MKEQIEQLILEGETGAALKLLMELKPGDQPLLLLAQYNSGKKEYDNGIIEFKDWQRIQAKLNRSAIDLLGKK